MFWAPVAPVSDYHKMIPYKYRHGDTYGKNSEKGKPRNYKFSQMSKIFAAELKFVEKIKQDLAFAIAYQYPSTEANNTKTE